MTKDEEFVNSIIKSVEARMEYHKMKEREEEDKKRRMDATEFIKNTKQWKQ